MANEFIVKDFVGPPTATTLTVGVAASTLAMKIASSTNWPTGANGPWVAVIARGFPTEERVLVSARTGLDLTILQRGYDNTPAVKHAVGAPIEWCLDAMTIKHGNALASAMTTRGDMACRSSALSFRRLANVTGRPIVSGALEPDFALLDVNGFTALVQQRLIPAGVISSTVAATPDPGHVFIDGSTIVNGEVLYPAAWAKLPAGWKSSPNIILPNWCGRTLLNAGTGAGLTARTLDSLVGSETHTLQTGEMGVPVHNHGVTDPTHNHAFSTGSTPRLGAGGPISVGPTGTQLLPTVVAAGTGVTVNNATGAAAGAAHNNMQPNAVVNMQIKLH